MTALNWRFVSVAASKGSIMFMLCHGDKLICEFSRLITRKKGGHSVTTGTTSDPLANAMIMEKRMDKSGVKIDGPTMSDFCKSVNYGRQLGFVKEAKPTVEVVIIDLFEWKRIVKLNLEQEKKDG